MPGKVPPDELAAHVFSRTGADDERVLQGPALGEDAAAIDVPAGTLVVSSDPISLAAADAGALGVRVACNDVAASGGEPRWLTVVCMLPTDDGDAFDALSRALHDAASDAGVTIVGGHSEYVDALDRPLLSLTAMGFADPFVPTGGATTGDRVVLAGAAATEGSAILAADFGDELAVDDETVERASEFLDDVSVTPAARALRGAATAMHDPTEGGIAAGLVELAAASGVDVEVDRDAIPVRAETETLCGAAEVDPLRIFGSGALLATVPESALEDRLSALRDAGIDAAAIGTVTGASDGTVSLDGETLSSPPTDELYSLWEAADARE